MRMTLAALSSVLALAACEPKQVNNATTTDPIFATIESARELDRSGNLQGADSAYQSLLASSANTTDSARIATSYVSLLIRKGALDEALFYIDKAFPANSADPKDLLRRYSYRFSVYMDKHRCDSIRMELNNLFNLVENHGPLQLSMEDLIHNRTVIDSLCGTPDTLVVDQ